MRLYKNALRYFRSDPTAAVEQLRERFGAEPRAFRTEYYSWSNRFVRKTGVLPSYKGGAIPYLQPIKLHPTIKQMLVRGALLDASGEPLRNSLGLILVQEWNLFTGLDLNEFTTRIVSRDFFVNDIALIDYPCSQAELNARVEKVDADLKIIFVIAYIFVRPDFSEWITGLIARHPNILLAVYFTDSHHMVPFGCSIALVADYLISSHPDNYQILSSLNPFVYLDKTYLCQWDAKDALKRCQVSTFTKRDLSLYGEYNFYPQFPLRNKFVTSLSLEYGDTVKLNSAAETRTWLARSRAGEALNAWMRYGITLIVPTRYDFTTRICDALSAGHAILLPKGCTWLDHWIGPDEQWELGIYRYQDLDASSLRETYQMALERETSTDSQMRAVRRSCFCLEKFSQEQLVESFLRITRSVLQ